MTELIPPALFALVLWWLSTGAVLAINSLSSWTYRWSLVLIAALAGLSLWGIVELSELRTPAAAYLSFIYALVLWGWHEMSFLMGFITGPVKRPCPEDAVGFRRFVLATGAVIYHEVALALTLVVLWTFTAASANRVALLTYVVLWIMRLSAKFNLYLGVRNVTEEFIPERMRYLGSYFGRRDRNPLMVASVLGGSGVLVWLGSVAIAARADRFEATATMLVATLLALALLEHLFLAFPVRDAVLWRWALGDEETGSTDGSESAPSPKHDDSTIVAASTESGASRPRASVA